MEKPARWRTIAWASIRLRVLSAWFCFLHDRRESAAKRLEEDVAFARDLVDITY